LGSLSLP